MKIPFANSPHSLAVLQVRQDYKIDAKVKIKSVFNILISALLFAWIIYSLRAYILPYFNMDLINKACYIVGHSGVAESINNMFSFIVPQTDRISKMLSGLNANDTVNIARILVITSLISALMFLGFNIINSIICLLMNLTEGHKHSIKISVFVISDIFSATVSYISLAIFFVAACFIAVLLPVAFFDLGNEIYFYATVWVISLIASIIVIVKFVKFKRERLSCLYDLRENIFTYFAGVIVAIFPAISAIIILAVLTIIMLIIVLKLVIYITKGLAFGG